MSDLQIAGLSEADEKLRVAQAHLTAMRNRVAEAEAAERAAMSRRASLVGRTAAGEVVTAAEHRDVEQAIRDAETAASILRDALPSAERDVAQAQTWVGDVLQRHARDLQAAAARVAENAEAEASAAHDRFRKAQDALYEATRFVAASRDRAAWGARLAGVEGVRPTISETDWSALIKASPSDQKAMAARMLETVPGHMAR